LETAKTKELLNMALELDPEHEKAKAFLKRIGGDVPAEKASSPPEAGD
jgi:hypothetical protein